MVDRAMFEVTSQTKKNKDTPGGRERIYIDWIHVRLGQEKGRNRGLKGKERGPSQDPCELYFCFDRGRRGLMQIEEI
jgi:hypothetical protein